jgi:CheY-like chemotaxis protein
MKSSLPTPIRVLLVDDDPVAKVLIEHTLARASRRGEYAVDHVSSVEQGLARVAAGAHDVWLVD